MRKADEPGYYYERSEGSFGEAVNQRLCIPIRSVLRSAISVPISAQKRLRSIFQAPRACTKLSGGPHRLFSIDLAVQSHGDGSWSSPVVGTPQHSLHTKIDQYRLIS